MKGCSKFEQLGPAALYEELDADESKWFEAHLGECPNCSKLFAEMKSTLNAMDAREREEPPSEFWQNYWGKLEGRLGEDRSVKTSPEKWWRRLSGIFETQPKWAYQLAGGLALLFIGILIGKLYFGSQAPLSTDMATIPSASLATLTVDERAERYLQRSKLLLLGLVNTDVSDDETPAIDFALQRGISQQLVQEAYFLKNEMHAPDQQRVKDLVSDLELILLQLANLESEHDLPAVELAKSAVNSRAILLRINLEEMRELNVQDSKKKKGREPSI
jgi:hypothetical protein